MTRLVSRALAVCWHDENEGETGEMFTWVIDRRYIVRECFCGATWRGIADGVGG